MAITRDALLLAGPRSRRAERRAGLVGERGAPITAERAAFALATAPPTVIAPPAARAVAIDDLRCDDATVARISLWTVLKVSVVFWVIASAITLAVLTLGVSALSAAGLLHDVEKFIGDAFGLDHFTIDTSALWRAGVALSILGACVATLLTVLAAGLYNLYASIVGGITLELHSRPRPLDD